MAKKEFTYYGKRVQELKEMSVEEFAAIAPSRVRRSLRRGFTEEQKKLLKALNQNKDGIKTHVRDMIILPSMITKTILVHRGNSFERVTITPEMIGHYLGEFTYNRKRVAHSAPGIGATRSSAAISVK